MKIVIASCFLAILMYGCTSTSNKSTHYKDDKVVRVDDSTHLSIGTDAESTKVSGKSGIDIQGSNQSTSTKTVADTLIKLGEELKGQ